jgi:hypothetical protein
MGDSCPEIIKYIYTDRVPRLIMQTTNANDIDSILFAGWDKFNWIIARVKVERIKHKAVINSIESHVEWIPLKRSMSNIQPARSRKLIKNTAKSNIHIDLLAGKIFDKNRQLRIGTFSLDLPDIGSLKYLKNS